MTPRLHRSAPTLRTALLLAPPAANSTSIRRLQHCVIPPTPQIPGAVTVGLLPTFIDPRRNDLTGANKYDMPPAGAEPARMNRHA